MKKIAFLIIVLLSVQNVHATIYELLNHGVGITHPEDPRLRRTISIIFNGGINKDDYPTRDPMNVKAPDECNFKERKVVRPFFNIKTLTFNLLPVGGNITAETKLPIQEIHVDFGYNEIFSTHSLGTCTIKENIKKVVLNFHPDDKDPLNYPYLSVTQREDCLL